MSIRTSELRAKKFSEEFQMVSDGIMHPKSITILGGPPKSYKSFILNTILAHLCTGTPLFGAQRRLGGQIRDAFRTQRPYCVLLFEQEIGEYSYQERIESLVKGLPQEQAELVDRNLWIHSCDRSIRLDTVEGLKALVDVIRSQDRPDVICLDPLVEFHNCDENSTQEMVRMMHNLDLIRDAYGCSFIITHHTGKPSESRHGADALRGNSAIFGKGDTFLMLEVSNMNARIVRVHPILRRGKPLKDFFVKMDPENLRFVFAGWDNAATKKALEAEAKKTLNSTPFDSED